MQRKPGREAAYAARSARQYPSFLHISDGKWHQINLLDWFVPEAGAFYVMDRGYLDFERLYALDQASSFFVIRTKGNFKRRRVYSQPVDRRTGLICDQLVELTVFYSQKGYPARLRRIRFKEPDTGKRVIVLTNHMQLPALTICQLYRLRWQVELFFKWIKQHPRIKAFFGTSENAVKSQPCGGAVEEATCPPLRLRVNCEASAVSGAGRLEPQAER